MVTEPGPRPASPAGLAVQEMLDTRFRDEAPFYAEMLAVFVETSREPIVRMRGALSSGAWGDLRSAAHFVKGGALTVGAELMADGARQLEEWARAREAGGAGDGPVAADARLDALEAALRDIDGFALRLAEWACR